MPLVVCATENGGRDGNCYSHLEHARVYPTFHRTVSRECDIISARNSREDSLTYFHVLSFVLYDALCINLGFCDCPLEEITVGFAIFNVNSCLVE